MRKCLREKCGKEFEPKRPKSKFCSDQCRIYNHRETKAKTQKSDNIFLDENAIEKIAEILASKMNIQSATVKKVKGNSVGVFDTGIKESDFSVDDLINLQNKFNEAPIPKYEQNDVDEVNGRLGILKKITEIENEKIPKERDTSLGRAVWKTEQYNRIQELKKQLK